MDRVTWHLPGRDPLRATLAGAVFIIAAFLLGWLQRTTGALTPLDRAVQHALPAIQVPPLTILMRVLTRLGSEGALTAVAVALYVYGRRRECILLLLLLLFAGAGANEWYKEWFALPRPTGAEQAQLDVAQGFGYPSGHTLTGVFLAWLVYHLVERRWLLCALIAPLMACTRIYLGVHYTSDTIGGMLNGVGWLFMASAAVLLLSRAYPADRVTGDTVRRGLLGGGIAAGVLFAFWTPNVAQAVRFAPLLAAAGVGASLVPAEWRPRSPLHYVPMLVLGLGLVLGVRVGLGAVLPHDPAPTALRYALMGFVLGVVPALFVRLRLATATPVGQGARTA